MPILLLIFTILVSGCQEVHERSQIQIAGGYLVDRQDQIARMTVAFLRDSGTIFCSGTYLGDGLILTAAHCFGANSESKVAFGMGHGFFFRPTVLVAKAVKHPCYKPSDFICSSRNDLAIARVDVKRVPKDYIAANFGNDFDVRIGEDVVLSGYGYLGIDQPNSDKKLRATKAIINKIDPENKLIYFRSTDGSSSCLGDSGGPMFRSYPNGRLMLIGTTRGPILTRPYSMKCRDEGEYTDVTKLMDWIAEQAPNKIEVY